MRLFVCHASEDKVKVRELVHKLREAGLDPWLDEERLLAGQDWQHEISTAVRQSDAVIVCLSRTSVEKTGYVQKELRQVLDAAEYRPERRTFVVPVRLEACTVPSSLQHWQYADLFVAGGFDRLCQALNARMAAPGTVDHIAEATADPKRAGLGRRRAIATCVTGLVSLAVLLVFWWSRLSFERPASQNPAPARKVEEPAPDMVRIPRGTFLMGRNGFSDPAASPAHDVTVGPFDLDRTPVTNARFRQFLRSKNMAPSPSAGTPGDEDWPVTGVTWDDAAQFCLAEGKRLPTEAEWEFAARGNDGRLYPWGEDFNAEAVNSRESRIGRPEPVGSRLMNRAFYGALDMVGNIWQWCADDYRPYQGRDPRYRIPTGAKVIRGGSFRSDRLHVTAVSRNFELPSTRSPTVGFRCAK